MCGGYLQGVMRMAGAGAGRADPLAVWPTRSSRLSSMFFWIPGPSRLLMQNGGSAGAQKEKLKSLLLKGCRVATVDYLVLILCPE